MYEETPKTTIKRQEIKKLSSDKWDGTAQRNLIKEKIKSEGLEIIEPATNHSSYDWITTSDNLDFSSQTVSLQQDGDLHFNLKLHPYIPFDKRKKLSTLINGKSHNECTTIEKVPLIKGLKGTEYTDLTKLYDTKKAVKKAMQKGDLVIVAGDASNDVDMLNPGNYIDLLVPEIKNLKHHQEKINGKLEKYCFEAPKDVIRYFENHPEVREKFEKLPLVSICVKNAKHSSIKNLYESYKDFAGVKILSVEPFELQQGVEQAIKLHSQGKSVFAETLEQDIPKLNSSVVKKENKKTVEKKSVLAESFEQDISTQNVSVRKEENKKAVEEKREEIQENIKINQFKDKGFFSKNMYIIIPASIMVAGITAFGVNDLIKKKALNK